MWAFSDYYLEDVVQMLDFMPPPSDRRGNKRKDDDDDDVTGDGEKEVRAKAHKEASSSLAQCLVSSLNYAW